MAKARDPRLTPARPDVAASFLRGEVTADRFDPGTPRQVVLGVAPVRRVPEATGPQETQLLFGEIFTVYDEADGWAWGQSEQDKYVGYVETDALSEDIDQPDHALSALRAYWFSKPDLKSAPYEILSLNAKLTVLHEEGDYVALSRGGFVWKGAVRPLDHFVDTDPVAVAETFLHTPYFWGGKESLGLDCSGLLQNAYEAIGLAIPRDADQQEAHFSDPARGYPLWSDDRGGRWQDLDLQRGDLMFWPGHTGMMVDDTNLIHANATRMATSIDDVREISARWAEDKQLLLRRIIRPIRGL
ncbi:C40 family peptidase [Parvularcula sp. LCG005]|uniref:C40 family peptidase n=1 Tax=Parvularcula sp. LCG005 TaxID=3078805 RepID=UPI0029439654|nr:NlpC/P60 family protein [Parvularcula sp. LCG005]WOI53167.1 NlpC/P60 family protein [Parvularcula sp. LCG005]